MFYNKIAAYSRTVGDDIVQPDGTHDHIVQAKKERHIDTITEDPAEEGASAGSSSKKHRRKRSDHLNISLVGENQPTFISGLGSSKP
ncbi:MAG: hypothetical protein EOP45_14110 [Sphingobacteriaceae bacterium]|nr:MAG: hypothetical protein EOP45_14110 [Sphingobacteriaceae bacterium]